jgi:hypothetical protein
MPSFQADLQVVVLGTLGTFSYKYIINKFKSK